MYDMLSLVHVLWWKEMLNNDAQQLHQYQQNKQLSVLEKK